MANIPNRGFWRIATKTLTGAQVVASVEVDRGSALDILSSANYPNTDLRLYYKHCGVANQTPSGTGASNRDDSATLFTADDVEALGATPGAWIAKHSGSPMAASFGNGDSGAWFMDLGVSGYVAASCIEVVRFLDDAVGRGETVNGIYFDNASGSATFGMAPFIPDGYTQGTWRDAVIAYYAALADALKDAGYYCVANMTDYYDTGLGESAADYNNGDTIYRYQQQVIDYIEANNDNTDALDGLFFEFFGQLSDGTKRYVGTDASYKQWDNFQGIIEHVQTTLNRDFHATAIENTAFPDAGFELASALLDLDPTRNSTLWIWNIDDTTATMDNPDLIEDVGTPLGPKSADGSGWKREFSLFTVYVNPTTSSITMDGHSIGATSYLFEPTGAVTLLYDDIDDAFGLTRDGSPHTIDILTTGATLETDELTYGEGFGGVWLKIDLNGYAGDVDVTLDIEQLSGAVVPYVDVWRVTDATFNPASPEFGKLDAISGVYWGDGTTHPTPVTQSIDPTDSATGIFYLIVTDWDFTDTTGTTRIIYTIDAPPLTINAPTYANVGGTVTLQDSGTSVQDTQDPYADDFDGAGFHNATNTLTIPGGVIPPGKYSVSALMDNDATYNTIAFRRGNKPVGPPTFVVENLPPGTGTSGVGYQVVHVTSPDGWTKPATDGWNALPFLFVGDEDLNVVMWGDNSPKIKKLYFYEINSDTSPSESGGAVAGPYRDGPMHNAEPVNNDRTPNWGARFAQTDDGTIYCLTMESIGFLDIMDNGLGPYLFRLDGTSWTYLYDFRTATGRNTLAVNIETDGIDLWVAWMEFEDVSSPIDITSSTIYCNKWEVGSGTAVDYGVVFQYQPGSPGSPGEYQFPSVQHGVVLGVSRHDCGDPSRPYVAMPAHISTSTTEIRIIPFVWNSGTTWSEMTTPEPPGLSTWFYTSDQISGGSQSSARFAFVDETGSDLDEPWFFYAVGSGTVGATYLHGYLVGQKWNGSAWTQDFKVDLYSIYPTLSSDGHNRLYELTVNRDNDNKLVMAASIVGSTAPGISNYFALRMTNVASVRGFEVIGDYPYTQVEQETTFWSSGSQHIHPANDGSLWASYFGNYAGLYLTKYAPGTEVNWQIALIDQPKIGVAELSDFGVTGQGRLEGMASIRDRITGTLIFTGWTQTTYLGFPDDSWKRIWFAVDAVSDIGTISLSNIKFRAYRSPDI